MKLLERYATECGLKIGKQYLIESFYPLPFDKYITLHAGAGMQGKAYPYYHMVINLISSYLENRGIRIVQIGGKDEIAIPGCYHLNGKTNLNQASFIIRNAILHLGNDSIWGHRASYIGIPVVQPWGTTDPKNHSGYNENGKTINIVSHRWGRKPSFVAQENPSSIALIPPEDIADAILDTLNIEHDPFPKTQYIGSLYHHVIFDWIPNSEPVLNLNPEIPLTVRMDLVFSEQNLIALLQSGRRITLVTNKPINLNILVQFRQSILSYSHEINTDCPLDYVVNVRRILNNVGWFTREKDESLLSSLRFHFFDVCQIESVPLSGRSDYLNEASNYLNKKLDVSAISDKLYFRTNKLIMSKGKVYLSYAHESADSPATSVENREAQIIDNDLFWKEYAHYNFLLRS